jgi:uncharacterized protein DUF2721
MAADQAGYWGVASAEARAGALTDVWYPGPRSDCHIIRMALTPVFLLSGIATLLNVFSARLARVADRVEAVGKAP